MGSKKVDSKIGKADLEAAYRGSWYCIAGCGGPLTEWIEQYELVLGAIGKPDAWYRTTGKEINEYAGETTDPFADDLICLLFPLDGLDIGRLAGFKLAWNDRWFDDVVDNMRS